MLPAAEDAHAAGAAPSDGPCADTDEEDVWFEVSPNTARVHLHAAPDGSSPLGLSLPVRALLARNEPAPLLQELVAAVQDRWALAQKGLHATPTDRNHGQARERCCQSHAGLLLSRA